jgi:L-asparaginase
MPGLAGIVVTHGTATLEETAFFLHLTWPHETPLVLVGAQRPPDTEGSDAVPNLRAAMAVAASPEARGMGVLIVMNGEIFSSVDATKSANFRLDAFTAPQGKLGRVDPDGSVRFARSSDWRDRPCFVPHRPPPRVDMLLSHAGGDGTAVRAFVEAGARGIVAMALPPGRVAAGERQSLVEAAAQGVVVVLASRAIRDGVPIQDYNIRDKILSAGDLAAHKARILLMLALGENRDPVAIQELMLAAR